MPNDSRASMVRGAASLISSRGLNATAFSDVLAESGAPRGSIYHHFPGGKRQLAEDVMRLTSELVLGHQRACPGESAREILEWFIDLWRRSVVNSAGAYGCAIAGVALDTAGDSELLAVAQESFRSWSGLLAGQLEAAGLTPDEATRVALTVVASMEGALIVCRAEQSAEPLEIVAAAMLSLLPDVAP
jgi:TetR/AcrR family transcriptional repressor of lmrAB and yxaGH operons